MIRFTFTEEKDIYRSLIDLMDYVRGARNYRNTQFGPLEDYSLKQLNGFIIDGTDERALADDFENKVLKKTKREYQRGEDKGVRYFLGTRNY